MPVDNEIYDRLAGSWWDEDQFIYLLRAALNPIRFAYFEQVIEARRSGEPGDCRLLDVGCGGGYMTEEFARAGYRVCGVDPSEPTIEAARSHAESGGLRIEYRVAAGEQLPFEEASFDFVYCCDTLEHVDDLPRVISEVSRVLAGGGAFLYDTINRTLRANLFFVKVAQDWRLTSFMPPDLHDPAMFIKPSELEALMEREGMRNQDLAGMSGANPLTMAVPLWRVKRGKISYREFGERLRMRKSQDTSVSYIGWALKEADGGAGGDG